MGGAEGFRAVSCFSREFGGWDAGVSARTVDACIKRLRQKLGPAGAYIQTVRGVGYRFVKNGVRVVIHRE